MKPCGPGLSFVKRLLITELISLLVIVLFRFSISHDLVLVDDMFSELIHLF